MRNIVNKRKAPKKRKLQKNEVIERLKESEKELKTTITKLKHRIDASKETYKTIFDNTGTATIIVEEDTTISLVNEQFEALFGYSKEEIEWKKSWTEFIVEEDLERMKKLHYSRRKDPESTQRKYEFRLTDKKGDIRDIFIVIDLIPGTKKSVASLLDISERKKMEEKLKDSEEKYRYLFNNAQVGLYWSKISDGEFIECNDTFAKIFGYDTREECLANYNAVEHYIDPKARSELIEEIRVNKEVKNYEIHITRRDGAPIWLSLSTRMVEKEDRFEGAAIDITERKKAERELQLERDNFINILNSMEDGVYIVDQNYNLKYVNPSLIKDFGQFEGKKCFKYFEDRDEICPRCNSEEIFQGKTVRGEWFSLKSQKTYDLIDTPLKNPDGSVLKLTIFRDETDKKQAEKKIKVSEEKYKEAYNRAEFYKDLFAHDINNILQSILSGIQISQLIVDDPEKHDNLKINSKIIEEQVIRGAKLVSNVRKLSQLEGTEQRLKKIEIFTILKNTISFLKKSYKEKNLAIRVDSEGEKLFIKANNLLEDVFENLLINSIRHNKNLTIEITVRISKEQQNGISYLKMEFIDNGLGIADIMKKKIFNRGNNEKKSSLGMGLGLSLVRGIIETYNGKIWVEDRVKGDRSKGSNFVLLIPEVD